MSFVFLNMNLLFLFFAFIEKLAVNPTFCILNSSLFYWKNHFDLLTANCNLNFNLTFAHLIFFIFKYFSLIIISKKFEFVLRYFGLSQNTFKVFCVVTLRASKKVSSFRTHNKKFLNSGRYGAGFRG